MKRSVDPELAVMALALGLVIPATQSMSEIEELVAMMRGVSTEEILLVLGATTEDCWLVAAAAMLVESNCGVRLLAAPFAEVLRLGGTVAVKVTRTLRRDTADDCTLAPFW